MSSPRATSAAPGAPVGAQKDSREWLRALRLPGTKRDQAVAELHELLLRAARFEVSRRRAALSHVRGDELDDLALQAADDALVAVLAKLDDYRGASRFTTWAYKFALLEAGVRLRRRAWQEREVVLVPEAWPLMADASESPENQAETDELMQAITQAVDSCLTEHQREVLVGLALNGVPIDVLAERLNTTRGALYKTLHDARRKLRADLGKRGFTRLHARLDLAETIMDKRTNDTVLKRLLGPADPELLCDECFEKLDEYVDLELEGAPADEQVPGLRAHLEGCPACQEEYASLRALVEKAQRLEVPAGRHRQPAG